MLLPFHLLLTDLTVFFFFAAVFFAAEPFLEILCLFVIVDILGLSLTDGLFSRREVASSLSLAAESSAASSLRGRLEDFFATSSISSASPFISPNTCRRHCLITLLRHNYFYCNYLKKFPANRSSCPFEIPACKIHCIPPLYDQSKSFIYERVK